MGVILYVWLGMVVTLVSLALVALARCILNRSKVERVREQVENIIHSQLQHENHCQLIQPMLGGYLESGDSSRSTTATHSRTSSGVERPKTLLPLRDPAATLAPLHSTTAKSGT